MSVVVCDDHVLFLDALASELVRLGQEVVSASDNPAEALRAVVSLTPDVCLVDLAIGADSGLALAGSVRMSSPGTAIILLTGADGTEVWPAIESGAVDGAVSKICDIAVLVAAIQRVLNGDTAVVEGWSRPVTRAIVARRSPKQVLTGREAEIMRLLAAGASNQRIADQLGISRNTVRAHVHNLLNKLQVHSRAKAVALLAVQQQPVPEQRASCGLSAVSHGT
jgi:two-component system, NarL family, response regulator DevR